MLHEYSGFEFRYFVKEIKVLSEFVVRALCFASSILIRDTIVISVILNKYSTNNKLYCRSSMPIRSDST
jgi:hypothetical protein